MQFDVVIGNPPYNKDMYLGFCENAFSLLKPDGVMVQITPAKFYGKGGQANEHFREVIMPHIDEVHLYKCCTDVFDIAERGGIAYWRAVKDKTSTSMFITNHSKNTSLASEREEHTEQPVQFMSLSVLRLIDKVKQRAEGHTLFENYDLMNKYAYYVGKDEYGQPNKTSDSDIEILKGAKGVYVFSGYISYEKLKTYNKLDKIKVCASEAMANTAGIKLDSNNMLDTAVQGNIVDKHKVPKGSFPIFYFADTEDEAKSFISYMNSQLVSYIIINSQTTHKTCSDENWRHVPALPEGYKFDHIYTNEEIFDIFQLTPEEKDLITSLIKPRSKKEEQ